MQNSFWEHDSFYAADFIVIGAGLIGLQVALQLKRRAPKASVLVLERGTLPTGASTRNAGFACFGSLSEILADLGSMGEDATLALVGRRQEGLSRLRSLLGEEAIGYEHAGGHELILREHKPTLEQMHEINRLLQPLFEAPVFEVLNGFADTAGFGSSVHAVLGNAHEGQLHSGLAMRALRAKAAAEGVEIVNGVEVSALHEEGQGMSVQTSDGARFRAGQVAVCTNAWISALLPELAIAPARGQVLLTTPLADLRWRGAYHLDEGFYYFRNVGQRVLLGGARHLAFEQERSFVSQTTDTVQQALEKVLAEIVVPGQAFEIEARWAGIMGFSPDKQPVVQRVNPHTVAAFGCNGMGVALSPMVAQEAAELLLA
jgi:glycine/D-amino acid oxidase-like deaminating enzyme